MCKRGIALETFCRIWYDLSFSKLIQGVVRVLIQDDHFENYYFPKGTRFSILPLCEDS